MISGSRSRYRLTRMNAIHHRDERLFTAGGEGREERDSHGQKS